MAALPAVAFVPVILLPEKTSKPSAKSPATAAPLTGMLLTPALAPLPNAHDPPTASVTAVGLIISAASAADQSCLKTTAPFAVGRPGNIAPASTTLAWAAA